MNPRYAFRWAWRRFRHGPQGDTVAGRLTGHMLWWRTWAMIIVLAVPLAVGIAIVAATIPRGSGSMAVALVAVQVTWAAAVLLMPKAMSLSPKYEVEENY